MMRKRMTMRGWAVTLRIGWIVAIGLALGIMLLLSPSNGSMRVLSPNPTPTPAPCVSETDCSDNVFCNGIERCAPGQPGADSRGCVAAVPPSPCNVNQECDESHRRCVIAGCEDADHDGDGHRSLRCGGDDCDDYDANRFPGRTEVCDTAGHDEDCDPATYGHRDQDGDGEDDFRCFNRGANGTLTRGTDYDDNNPAIRLGSMICDGPDAVILSGSTSAPCPTGTKCVVQPNKTGICIVEPSNYIVPSRFEWPLLPQNPLAIAPSGLPPTLDSARDQLSQRPAVAPSDVPPRLDSAGQQPLQRPLAVAPSDVPPTVDSARAQAEQVAECKSTLQSGKISWGGGSNWASDNIDNLCNGTKNAKKTIACFQSQVESLGWAAAIDKCK